MNNLDPVLTIGVPMFRAGPIGWLSLESIVRQERVDFPWEVVVIEDADDQERMGEAAVREFEARMRANGCVSLQYELISGHPPLSLKWRRMGQLMHPAAKIFLLQGCDDYCDPLRFTRTVRLFSDPSVDWIQSRFGAFYDIATHQMVMYDNQLKNNYTADSSSVHSQPTGLNMAGKAEFFRDLPEEEVWRGVDQWVFRNVVAHQPKPLIIWDETEEDWKSALFTQGLNTISVHRWHMMRRVELPFVTTALTLPELVPAAVVNHLHGLVAEASKGLIQLLAKEVDRLEPKLEDFRMMLRRREEKIEKLTRKHQTLGEKVSTLKSDLARQKARKKSFIKRLISKLRLTNTLI